MILRSILNKDFINTKAKNQTDKQDPFPHLHSMKSYKTNDISNDNEYGGINASDNRKKYIIKLTKKTHSLSFSDKIGRAHV